MNERELDRAIDTAAGAMVAREPSRSLGSTVMARVREDQTPAPRRFVWVAAAASLVVCGAITIAMMNSGRVRLQSDRDAPAPIGQLPAAPRLFVGLPAVLPQAPVTLVAAAPPARPAIREAQSARRAPVPLADVSPIEPIQTDAIVLSSIDVPQLEREITAIDTLTIEPLTIEPLATSND